MHGSGSHHDHGTHGHEHAHAPESFGKAFAFGAVLNGCFVLVEAAFGFVTGSVALLADAGHNLSDVFGLLIAWAAVSAARSKPTPRYTYGLRSSSILAALANAILLLIAVGAIAWEAIQRFVAPHPVSGTTVMIVAGIGIVINAVTACLFASGRRDDLNVRAAFQHMAADAAVSLGVLLAGAGIVVTGWLWLDPVVSLSIAALIVWGTWSLLRDSVNLALHAVPAGIDPDAVRGYLASRPNVVAIHDLHIWAMSTTETALTCHLVMPVLPAGDDFLHETADQLRQRFKIAHATLQIECGEGAGCALAPDHVV